MTLCECGCGQEVNRKRRFVHGHNRRGKHHTEEAKKKISKNSAMRKPEISKKVSEANKGRLPWSTGKHFTEKSCKKMSDSHKGKTKENCEYVRRQSETKSGRTKENHLGIKAQAEKMRGRTKENNEGNRRQSEVLKRYWKDPEFVKKMFKAQRLYIRPNKPEKLIYSLLQYILPNEYKLNVKGEVMTLGRKIPDFININGQKKLIEFNGCYYHSCPVCYPDNGINGLKETEERIKLFKQYGWDTLVIWEHELKDMDAVVNRILEFHNLPSLLCSKQLTFE